VPGIVGAVGPRAVQAVRSMQQVLKHRGRVRHVSQGKLANDTEYAVMVRPENYVGTAPQQVQRVVTLLRQDECLE